jgi:hypothetical protein
MFFVWDVKEAKRAFHQVIWTVQGSHYLQDVDIAVLEKPPGWNAEDIKRKITERDSRFFLVPSKFRWKRHKVLWFRLDGRDPARKCKVDVAVAKKLDIQRVPDDRIEYRGRYQYPVVPLLLLLLLKLKGWDDHRKSDRKDFRRKSVTVDIDDIRWLLEAAHDSEDPVHLKLERWWFSLWFIRRSRRRVRKFVHEYPWSEERWIELGLYIHGR